MTPKQQAVEIFNQYYKLLFLCKTTKSIAIKCALIDVQNTLNANPHSNPFNTDGSSTYAHWLAVKLEIEKL